MTRHPIVVRDTMDCYIAFDTQENADWYKKAWPDVKMETAFDKNGFEYLQIMRDGKQIGVRWHYD